MAAQEPEYRAIFEASSDGLVINDADTGSVIEANPAFCRMHGYDRMVGLHPTTFIHPNSHHLFADYVRTLQAGGEYRVRAQDVRRDGTVFDVEVLGRRFTYQGRHAMLGVVRDVTEQVHAYQVLEQRVAERTREIDRRRQVAEVLRDLLATVNSGRALDEILQAVLAQAGRLLGSETSAVYLLDAEAAMLDVRAIHGPNAAHLASQIRVGRPVSGLAILKCRPVAFTDMRSALHGALAPDAQTTLEDRTVYLKVVQLGPTFGEADPAELQRLEGLAHGHPAVLAVPLLVDGQPRGTITLFYAEAREFGDEEVRLATVFADEAALAIENTRLRAVTQERTQEAEQRLRELEVLYDADQLLHGSLRLDRVLQALVDVAADILHSDKGTVLVWDAEHVRLIPGATRGFAPETIAQLAHVPGEGITGLVAQTRQPIAVPDTWLDPRVRRTFTDPAGIRALMHAPIMVDGAFFGVFGTHYCEPHQFSDDEKRILLSLAQRAALAIQNARLFEQAQQAAALEERQRLARELHDAVTQTLFSTALLADVIPDLWDLDPAEGRQRLEELRRLTRGALAEMRTLLVELRPGALTDLPLEELLRQLGEAAAGRTRLEVAVQADGPRQDRLPADVQVNLYRIAQEALNNIARHAQAQHASVRLDRAVDGALRLSIEDDGRGFDPAAVPAGHLGMVIMRERAQATGAALRVDSSPGVGTQIEVSWRPGQRWKPPLPVGEGGGEGYVHDR